MRVILHGFGSFPVFFYHVIQCARRINTSIEWAIILTSDHYESIFVDLLGPDKVMVWNQTAKSSGAQDVQVTYPGSLYQDIEAEKRTFKSLSAEKKYARALGMYGQVRELMLRFLPTHALVSQVEGFDGKAFIAAARELKVEVVVPTSCRNIGGIYFSRDDVETLPPYADASDELCRTLAQGFLHSFRTEPTAARWLPQLLDENLLEPFQKPFLSRLQSSCRRWLMTPGGFQCDFLRASLLNNMPQIRNLIWSMRRRKNEKLFNLSGLDELPEKYIYYPLQYSPESSINTPAPYFLDQFRAIDAIRFAMPSDYTLVVKEHPACILLRDSETAKRLLKTAGVKVIYYKTPSIELVKRAAVTISVTGTATLEAHLLGRPALVLGPGISAQLLGTLTTIDELPQKIRQCIRSEIKDEYVRSSVARLYSVRHEVGFGTPGMPNEPILRQGNVERFTAAFIEHCERLAP